MNSIVAELKNGKKITIRRIYGADYDDVMCFLAKFSCGLGAKWTYQYANQPIKDRERTVKMYENPNNMFVAAWDDNIMIGMASVTKILPKHPYSGRVADVGITILEDYTSNGLGNKLLQIIEQWSKNNKIHKLEANIRHKNTRSISLFLKNGYTIVGLKHDTAFIDAEWHHEYVVERIIE